MHDLELIVVSGRLGAHLFIVKTMMTSGMDIARVAATKAHAAGAAESAFGGTDEAAGTKMAVGGEGVRRLGPEIVRDPDEDH
jgi:hypothetical protein